MRGRWICPSPNTLKTFLWQSPPYSWRSNFKIHPVAVCWTCPLFRQETGLLWRERDKFHGSRSWISFYFILSRRVRRLKYSSFIFIFKISYRPEFQPPGTSTFINIVMSAVDSRKYLTGFSIFPWNLAFLTFSTNPIIYCWKWEISDAPL